MIYRPSRELLSESLEVAVEITTWQELYDILNQTDTYWVQRPLEITWESQGYDDRVKSDVWIVCLRGKNYGHSNAWGHIHGDPSTLIGYKPQTFIEPTYQPLVDNPNQKYHRGDRVRQIGIGRALHESDGKGGITTYDSAPKKVGRTGTIEYSYTDMFAGRDNSAQYSINWDEGGSSAWCPQDRLIPEDEEYEYKTVYPPASESNTNKMLGKIVQDIEYQLMWGKPKG